MSIMYPGLKPACMTTTHHTPMLCRLTANSGSQLGGGGSRPYDNLFQPIHVAVSQSPSNNSISSNLAAASTDTTGGAQDSPEPGQGEATGTVPMFRKENRSRPSSCENEEPGASNSDLCVAQGSMISSELDLQNNGTKSELHNPETHQVHQRSRSNEIDYTSISYGSRSHNISAFRSPPGTMRSFRPQSVDSAHGSLFSDITDSLSSAGISVHTTTPSTTTHRSNPSSSSSEATVVEVEGGAVESATGQASTGDREMNTGGKQLSTLDWLKDFDPGLISDYFSSTDEPRLKVTDC